MKVSSALTLSVMMLSQAIVVFAPAMKPVQRGQYPYLVLIRNNVREGARYYTGTLLSMRWVLTLSEGMFDLSIDQLRSQVVVYAGITRFSDVTRAQRRTISEVYKTIEEGNEKYPALLLLKVNEPFSATQDVQPAQVNNGYVQRRCIAVGWSKPMTPSATNPELVQTVVSISSTSECGDQYNAVSHESQICAEQSYEYSFFPGSLLVCSKSLSAIKSVDTYMSPVGSRDRVILYVRAKPYTTWMRAHVVGMKPMVVLPRGIKDNLMETWEQQPGSKRSGQVESPDNETSTGNSVISHSAGLALCCLLVVVATCKLTALQL